MHFYPLLKLELKMENLEQIQNFDNENFVHPWESREDVGHNTRMFAEDAVGI